MQRISRKAVKKEKNRCNSPHTPRTGAYSTELLRHYSVVAVGLDVATSDVSVESEIVKFPDMPFLRSGRYKHNSGRRFSPSESLNSRF